MIYNEYQIYNKNENEIYKIKQKLPLKIQTLKNNKNLDK